MARSFAEQTESAAGEPRLQRADGVISARYRDRDGVSALAHLHQSGCGKARFPKTYGAPEIVLLNTAGGLTGGDRMRMEVEVEAGATAIATTQAAERLYRSAGGDALVATRLTLGAGARLDWLPQETIVFEGGRLRRKLEVEMAADASLLAVEAMVFGRAAMGETVREGLISDQWRVRRGGSLAYADALRATAPIDVALDRAAGGGRAVASLIYVAPDAEARRDAARERLGEIERGESGLEAGLSAWNGLLSARLIAPAGAALRRALTAFLEDFRAAPLPRVWRL